MHFDTDSDSDDKVSQNKTERNDLLEMSNLRESGRFEPNSNYISRYNPVITGPVIDKKTGYANFQQLFRQSQSVDNNTEKIFKAMSAEEKEKYDEYVIKMGFDSKLKTYDNAKEIDSNTMKHAVENAFPLPMNQFYSTFVEIQGSSLPMFARYEVHQRVECTKNYII